MKMKEALECVRHAMQLPDDESKFRPERQALATLTALVERAGEPVAWHLESKVVKNGCTTRDLWWSEPGAGIREKFNVRPLIFGDALPPAADEAKP